MRGHNRKKPAVLKKLEGTYQPCRDAGTVSLETLSTCIPKAPSILKKEGLEFYNNEGKRLFDLKLLNEYNLAAFVTICYMITKTFEIARKLEKLKDTRDILSYNRLYMDYQKNLRLSLSEFGLTPASLNKIRLPEQPKEDKFREFMNDKG